MRRPQLKRVLKPELLDADAGTPEEVASALRSLRWVNQLFGGSRMHTRLLRRILRRHVGGQHTGRELHVLEVASGHANALQTALLRLRPPRVRVSLLDRSRRHLPGPGDWNRALPAPELITGDALCLPLADASVDVVSCCLFLHHLDEQQVRRFLDEALRVARVAVLVNDLERTRTHYWLARFFSLVDPSRISRHDGPVSVGQAYTCAELTSLLRASGQPFRIERGYLFRLGVTVWKSAP